MHVGLCVALLAVAILHALGTRAEAAEAATGVDLLGSRGLNAGTDANFDLSDFFLNSF
jgi:hypothetical protein